VHTTHVEEFVTECGIEISLPLHCNILVLIRSVPLSFTFKGLTALWFMFWTFGSLSPRHGAFSGCKCKNNLQIWRVAVNILNKESRTTDKGWSSGLEIGQGATNNSAL
jgi:hypothetical protein